MRWTFSDGSVRPGWTFCLAIASSIGALACAVPEASPEVPTGPQPGTEGQPSTPSPGGETEDEERRELGPPAWMPPISREVWMRAVQQRDQLPPATFGIDVAPGDVGDGLQAAPPTGRWEFIGPQGLGYSGRVNRVAFAPSRPATRYLTAPEGGVWRTTDSGGQWQALSDTWQWLSATAIAVDPTNDQLVLAGSGDFDNEAYSRRQTMGIMRSTNGGASWSQTTGIPNTNAVPSILFDPDNPNIVLAALGRGLDHIGAVWRSVDRGLSWRTVSLPAAVYRDLAMSPKESNGTRYLYATADDRGGLLWRSADRGVTWQQVATPRLPDVPEISTRVAVSLRSPKTVYLLQNKGGAYSGWTLFKSTDTGLNWTDISLNLDLGNQGDTDIALAVGNALTSSGATEDVVYACAQQQDWFPNRNPPTGGHLQAFQATYPTPTNPAWRNVDSAHADCHDIQIDPTKVNGIQTGYKMLIANDGGLYSQAYNSSTKAWGTAQSQNATLGLSQMWGLGTHPGDLTQVVVGTQDNATLLPLGNLTTWQIKLGGTDGGWSAFARATPTTVYAVEGGYFDRSKNGGVDFSWLEEPLSGGWAFGAAALDSSDRLYVADTHLYRLDNATDTWDILASKTPLVSDPSLYVVTAIAAAPSDPNILYVGSDDGYITRVSGALTTAPSFDHIHWDLPPMDPPLFVWSLSVNPSDPNDVLVGGWRPGQCDPASCGIGGLWRWSGGGWSRVDGSKTASGLPEIGVNAIARDPDAPTTTWYVATAVGVFQTTDGGLNWTNATAPLGLPNVFAYALDLNSTTRYLTVGTFGRGVWRIKLAGGSLPDLAATASSASRVSGGIQFSATIRNQGSPATPGNVIHQVDFYLDNVLRASSTSSTSALGAGSSRTLTAKWTTSTSVTGSHTLKVVIDRQGNTLQNRISESNETNNTRTSTITL